MTAYDALMGFTRETMALAQVAGRLGWDQETMMPRGAAEQRAEEMAALESVLHARRTDPRVAEWLTEAEPIGDVATAQLRHIRRSFERAQKVPADLASALARTTSRAQGQWAQARADEDFAAFAPVLDEVLRLRRQEAQALAQGGDLYDALLDDYEPECKAADLQAMFDALRPHLVSLRAAALEKPAPQGLSGQFDAAQQMQLATLLAQAFGYDLDNGRLDKAVHPFSSGSGLDVRITTRTDERDPFNCIYSTIHEVGHACYEQNIDRAYLLSPLGQGVSMGVHESQSRIYENQLGRSRAFTGWLFGQMRDYFGDIGVSTEEAFYAAVNRLQNGFIRTEADEVQYNLHIMLRFDLERAMIAGDLSVSDLPAAWNDRFAADFGFQVDKPSNGCLQDVHWSVGLFGYFPTYSLGNVYAGCLHAALRKDVTNLDDALATGNTLPATDWLKDKLQTHGGLRNPQDTITHACGHPPSEKPLVDYLTAKFSDLYQL
ncbi:carboxypeptidase M32 [Thalassovita sp.]|jgi:carboxypeptidase Taq|uniref:carboxypeptidase M32 n=1 Tax=Thalassovita sp. TaxID=1979401 RepID=UPI003B5A51AB